MNNALFYLNHYTLMSHTYEFRFTRYNGFRNLKKRPRVDQRVIFTRLTLNKNDKIRVKVKLEIGILRSSQRALLVGRN